jgi:hypothetical protein
MHETTWLAGRFPHSLATAHITLSSTSCIKCGLLLSCSITPVSKRCSVLLFCTNASSSSSFFNRLNAFKFLVRMTNRPSLRHETPFKSFKDFKNCLLYTKFTRVTSEVILYFYYCYIAVLHANRRFTLTMASDVSNGIIGPK